MMHWGVERQRLTPMARRSNIPLHASCGMAMYPYTSGSGKALKAECDDIVANHNKQIAPNNFH